ncbi:MAG: extracellular solute-binding protein [Oscillibacter sp.]|jgi:putative spermidine/putrescine transport system substrate-binding protein|uniref:extracellular solute-binding protein n=2 Tax=uncultured Oscillibacter sp. TaxID=876091 RepID=UPI0021714E6B|nr:extracellular solute-binding protein [uncultured Oscillibacter sp.]MCI9299527.1 extracellular solute-binding protein [Oscillibacter sp.]MCI9460761.1 extracellular solute-binding protein [Oscillibacter sp.]
MKRRLLTMILSAVMLAACLTGCGGKAGDSGNSGDAGSGGKKAVSLWATGSDNVREIFEALVSDFNTNSEYAGQYEVTLQFMLSGTGAQTLADMLAAASKAGQTNTDYDIVDLSGDDLSKLVSLIGQEQFVKLDSSKIPNAASVEAKSSIATDYCQPYRGTTVILAYDSAKVPTPPATMDELVAWMKANPGRFAYNTPGTGGAGDSFARSSVYNFLPEEAFTSDDEKWIGEWDEGFNFLKEIHPYIYSSGGSVVYPNKNQGTLDLLNQGEIDMCPNWADMVLSQRASGEIKDSIKITQIDPALTGSLQSLVIPTFGSNTDGAYAFMNYMLSPAAQELMVKQMAAIPLIDASSMDMTGYEDLQGLDVSNFRLQSIGGLSTSFNERWDSEIATIG